MKEAWAEESSAPAAQQDSISESANQSIVRWQTKALFQTNL
jgi:hypothetical protein